MSATAMDTRLRAAVRHAALDGNHLVELQRQLGSICALHGEVVDQGRLVFRDDGFPRHQEVDNDLDGRSAVVRSHRTGELKPAQVGALAIAMTPEHVDEAGVLTVPERFGVEGEIDIGRAERAASRLL